MPRPPLPQAVFSILTSTSHPTPPSLEDLEALRTALLAHTAGVSRRMAELEIESDTADKERAKRERKEKKRKEREENEEQERAALEANERAGLRLEALERARTAAVSGAASKGAGANGATGSGTGGIAAGPSGAGGVGKKGSSMGVRVKRERTSLSPAPSNASASSFRPPLGAAPVTYANQKKKKAKRVVDSDEETRDRSATLASPPTHTTTSGLKVKLPTHRSRPFLEPSPTPPSGVGSGIDFSLPNPPSRPLIPPRPGVQKPLKPGPKKQSEVNEDYSNAKAPNQVSFPTWWNTVEPYIRDIREDDLAMLTLKPDAPESYEIPPRGRHYTEVWDEEDGMPGSNPRVSVPNMRNGLAARFMPGDMRDENLVEEYRGLGSLTERVVAAMMAEERDMEGKVGEEVEGAGASRVDVLDLEERVKKELRAVMLLGDHEEYDALNRDDDEITSSLRHCQRLLSQQTGLNEQRKARLAHIAKQRLAHGEYMTLLDGIEKAIESGWSKRVKKYGFGKKPAASNNNSNGGTTGRPPVPEALKRLAATRMRWVEAVGQTMKERPRGEVVGLPLSSIYEGIGDDEETDEKQVEEAVELEEGMDVDGEE